MSCGNLARERRLVVFPCTIFQYAVNALYFASSSLFLVSTVRGVLLQRPALGLTPDAASFRRCGAGSCARFPQIR